MRQMPCDRKRPRHRPMGLWMALALSALLVSPSARAATFADMPFSELVDRSDRVVQGTVVQTQARFVDGPGSRILTDVTVRVLQDLLPDGSGGFTRTSPRTVVFATPGGVVGDQGQRVPGLPQYRVGDEVVLFLGPVAQQANDTPGAQVLVERRAVLGLALGAFFVHRDPAGGPAIVRRPVDSPLGDAGPVLGHVSPILLDRFTLAIRARRLSHDAQEAP